MLKRLFAMMNLVILVSILCSLSTAQQSPIKTPVTPRERMSDLRERSAEMERVRREANKPSTKSESGFPQIKEDFERIQLINSDVLQAKTTGNVLDYKHISEAAAEIKKRANRLKSNLFTSELEKSDGNQGKEDQDLKSMLINLDQLIVSFAHNPIFLNTNTVDPKDSEKAQRDLEKVIKLSGKIKKEADKMKKEQL